jgi:hypothetical protein
MPIVNVVDNVKDMGLTTLIDEKWSAECTWGCSDRANAFCLVDRLLSRIWIISAE